MSFRRARTTRAKRQATPKVPPAEMGSPNEFPADRVEIAFSPADDPRFVRIVGEIVSSVVTMHLPEELVIVQIDNWFDKKWLRFSGKMLGEVGVRGADGHRKIRVGAFLEESERFANRFGFRQRTFPPFFPNRVKLQSAYRRTEGHTYEGVMVPPLHFEQAARDNFNRKVAQTTDSGAFVWWSSSTIANGRGSLMIYTHVPSHSSEWYASFVLTDDVWRINRSKDIAEETLREFSPDL